jgi:hypothetical protein
MLIMIKVVTPTRMSTLDNWDLLERDLPYLTYTSDSRNNKTAHKAIFMR